MTTPSSRRLLDSSILKQKQRSFDKDKSFNQSDHSKVSLVDPNLSENNDENRSNLPTIAERLAFLRPSRELLEYYRRKLAEYDAEHDHLSARLDQYHTTCEEQHKMQWELRQREQEIQELQKALSDMQVYLFQEREHVLKLYADNDRLKIEQEDLSKKVKQLVQLSGLNERELVYFVKEPPAKVLIEQFVPDRAAGTELEAVARRGLAHHQRALGGHAPAAQMIGPVGAKKGEPSVSKIELDCIVRERDSFKQQVEALQRELEEERRASHEQVEAFTEEKRVRLEEAEAAAARDRSKLEELIDKLKKTQDLLYDSTKDFLELRLQARKQERLWMNEKDSLLRELDRAKEEQLAYDGGAPMHERLTGAAGLLHQSMRSSGMGVGSGSGGTREAGTSMSRAAIDFTRTAVHEATARFEDEIKNLNSQLEQQTKLADFYREQVLELEEQIAKLREEGDLTKDALKDRTMRVTQRLQLMQQRYDQLERRRNLEVEGFKTDIRLLRQRLKQLEKQLYKVTLEVSAQFEADAEGEEGAAAAAGAHAGRARGEAVDLAILSQVKRTAGRSKQIADQLRSLKSMMYELEGELRRL